MKWSMFVTDPRELYRAAKTVYLDPYHAKIAFLFSMCVWIVPVWIWFSSQPIGQAEDYSTVAVWLIIVPITMMVLVNYHLVMKPALRRKKHEQYAKHS